MDTRKDWRNWVHWCDDAGEITRWRVGAFVRPGSLLLSGCHFFIDVSGYIATGNCNPINRLPAPCTATVSVCLVARPNAAGASISCLGGWSSAASDKLVSDICKVAPRGGMTNLSWAFCSCTLKSKSDSRVQETPQ